MKRLYRPRGLSARERALWLVEHWTERDPLTGCWNWTGRHKPTGYGLVCLNGSNSTHAHRFIYSQLVGPVPDGMHLDHLCNNRRCVNPQHLEPVSPAENNHRRDKRGAA